MSKEGLMERAHISNVSSNCRRTRANKQKLSKTYIATWKINWIYYLIIHKLDILIKHFTKTIVTLTLTMSKNIANNYTQNIISV